MRMVPPDWRGLYFLGFFNSDSALNWIAEGQSRWIREHELGRAALPSRPRCATRSTRARRGCGRLSRTRRATASRSSTCPISPTSSARCGEAQKRAGRRARRCRHRRGEPVAARRWKLKPASYLRRFGPRPGRSPRAVSRSRRVGNSIRDTTRAGRAENRNTTSASSAASAASCVTSSVVTGRRATRAASSPRSSAASGASSDTNGSSSSSRSGSTANALASATRRARPSDSSPG